MGWFGLRKKDRVIDLSERYKKQQEAAQIESSQETSSQTSSGSAFPSFLGDMASASSTSPETESSDFIDVSSVDEKRRKLVKRLMEMTTKIEDLSNQIYHLQQRIEVLERKLSVGSY